MHPTPYESDADWQLLQDELRRLAQAELLPRFRHVTAEKKADGSLLTEADGAMQRACQRFLHDNWPQLAFVGEESTPAAQQAALQSDTGCWVLDPLDGTTNFAHGCPLFATSLALVQGGEVVLGLVYDPVRDELFTARKGQGATLNDTPIRVNTAVDQLKETLALIDFKRLPKPLAARLATEAPYASQRNIGAVVLDWCWIAAGRAEIYAHGGQGLWDYAAGHLILHEAGGVSATLDGEAVFNGTLNKRSAVAAASPELLQQFLALAADV
ncbi:myo-inositol-1(or 4)-monophosphatase [Sulfurivirga caldicuralii]|uniref:Myo-inositol-1(Or 4)-monophosphatase n=1 Tax=Sulfurivirga caldicuralii TaxID=364032 RepID=A0A1N6ERD0_9GAMM|nr:inositol monophosphatase [Sulfurivirga caldicuralii]SIN85558.1 myo-inositol-1(or 4)-monophosphatase [Sulfurivirga caldicuralii]